MAKRALVFESGRDGYSIGQVNYTMTVGELKSILEDHDDDDLVIISHDNGYTYGTLSNADTYEEDEDGDWASIYA